jgi:hypothetical protein
MARYMVHFLQLPRSLSTLEDGNANLSLLVRCIIKEVMGQDDTSGRISSAATSRQQSRLGSYDLVSCLETKSCFRASGSSGGSIIVFLMVPSSRFDQGLKRGVEEVDDVDGRRGGGEHKGRNEGGAPVRKPLLSFDQFFAPRLIKLRQRPCLT